MEIVIHTNLDLHLPETWPELDHVPQIGAVLQSKSGLQLRVVGVVYKTWNGRTGSGPPATYCVVELHLNNHMSIKEFNEWDRTRPR